MQQPLKENLNEQQAIELYKSKVWEVWTYEKKVKFQLFQKRLCMPFNVFHEAVEKVLNRSVWTHEFANAEKLQKEFLGEMPPPTFEEIMEMIPEEKRLILLK